MLTLTALSPFSTAALRRTLASAWSLNLGIYGLYLALALIITWPLATQLSTHFAGYPFGDAHEMSRHIWWFTYALRTGAPLIHQPLLGYPDGMAGIILWSGPLQFFPSWLLALLLPLPAAYNLAALLTLALNGWAAHWLAWKLTGVRPAALLAGALFLAAPTLQGHLAGGHGGLLVQWPLPLLAWQLLRLREGAGGWRLVLAAAFLTWLATTGHTLQLIYAALPLYGVIALGPLVERCWRALSRLLLAGALGALLLAVFLLPVWADTFSTAAYTGEDGSVTYSLDLLAPVTPSFNHPLFGTWAYTHRVLGTNIVEGSSYVGLAAAALGAIAVWRQRAARGWLLLAAAAYVLGLGPLLKVFDQPVQLVTDGYLTHITLPWALAHDLPGFSLARTPGRFNFVLALATAMLAGWGAAWLWQRLRVGRAVRGGLLLALAALALFEYQSFWPLPTFAAAVPEPVRALATRHEIRAVFDLPWEHVLAAKDALYLQTAHHKPLIAGQVTRRTPVSPAKLTLLQATLDPALLEAAGADVVIVHKTYDPDRRLRDFAADRLGSPTYEDDRLALFEAPAPAAPPAALAAPFARQAITDRAESYWYAPAPGWLTFSGRLAADGRLVSVWVDDRPVHRWTIDGVQEFDLRLPAAEPGYHTAALVVEPPCPAHPPPPLRCRSVALSDLALAAFTPAEFTPIALGRGVTLAGSNLALDGDQLRVGLWWQFGQPMTDQDVRFVHVVDADAKAFAQADSPLGAQAAGSERVDTITLDLAALPAGEYTVYAGWYSFPDLVRFPVLADTPRAQDGLVYLGRIARP